MAGTTGSVTITEQTFGTVKRIKFAWICGSSSQVDVVPATSTTNAYDGKVLQVVTSPDATDAPDANYDLKLKDADGVDQFCGSAANRHTSTTEVLVHSSSTPLGACMGTKLYLDVAGAGTSNQGTVYVYIR